MPMQFSLGLDSTNGLSWLAIPGRCYRAIPAARLENSASG